MGSFNSKSTCTRKNPFQSSNHLSKISGPRTNRQKSILRSLSNRQRSCSKKKVLLLGLDGAGKTDLFSRLTSSTARQTALVQPTIGYNVETIKLRCHHFYHRDDHQITLWDCGGLASVRSLWSYHYSNTSLLLWLINIYDRSRLDLNLQMLSQALTDPSLYRVPVLIVLYSCSFRLDNSGEENCLTNLEVAFRFLATISTSRASTFKWQVINLTADDADLKKVRRSFQELMDL